MMQTRTQGTTERMPLMIQDADFNKKLLVMGKNITHTQLFLDKGTVPFELPGYQLQDGYRFLKSRTSNQYRLVTAMPDGSPISVYVVEVVFHRNIVYPHQSCTQVMVWRTPDLRHERAVRGLPQHFFEYLLNEHDIIVSDAEQTGAGRRFWQTMLQWAVLQGYHIYIVDQTEMHSPLYKIHDMDEFYEKWDEFAWGSDLEVHPHRRAVLSKKNLLP